MSQETDRRCAERLADALGPEAESVLVLGAAPPGWAAIVRRRWPTADVVDATDGAAVFERARSAQAATAARELAEVVVVLASEWADGDSRELLRAATSRLRAGGRLTAIVLTPDEARATRPPSTYLRWLIDCGLRDVGTIDLNAPGTTGVRGRVDAFDDRPNRTASP